MIVQQLTISQVAGWVALPASIGVALAVAGLFMEEGRPL